MLKELDRQLAREAVVGTHHNVLGVACLGALTNIAIHLHSSFSAVLKDVSQLLARYTTPATPVHMRAAAYKCLMQVWFDTRGSACSPHDCHQYLHSMHSCRTVQGNLRQIAG